MSKNDDIVDALKAAREAKGLSQRALAVRAGVPQSHISKIESGNVDLQLSSLTELARVLDLEVKLVPRRALPTVEAIVRQTTVEPLRDEQARIQHALRNLAALAERLSPYDRSQSLDEIREATHFLQHVLLPVDELKAVENVLRALKQLEKVNLHTHYEEDIGVVIGTPKTQRSLKNAARVLRDIRNRVAHGVSAEHRNRPAYRLDEEETDG